MKKFKYKFTPLLFTLIIVAMVVAVAVIVANVVQLALGLILPDKIVSCSIAIFVAVVFIAFLIVILANSNYLITNDQLKTRLGLIVTGVKLKEVVQVVHFVKDKRLAIIFKDEEFSNIVIDPKHFDEFATQLKKGNPKIIYSTYDE